MAFVQTWDERRFMDVLIGILEAEFGASAAIRKADADYPIETYPLITLKIFSGPRHVQVPTERTIDLPSAVRATFSGATPGSDRLLVVNGFRFEVTGSSNTAHRDAMVAAINAGREPVSAAPVGADALDVTSTELGGLETIEGFPSPGVALEQLSTALCKVWETRSRVSVSVNAFQLAHVRPTASQIARQIVSTYTADETRELLRQHKIGHLATLGSQRDLTTLQGAGNEPREQLDLEFLVRERRVRPGNVIEAVELRNTMPGGSTTELHVSQLGEPMAAETPTYLTDASGSFVNGSPVTFGSTTPSQRLVVMGMTMSGPSNVIREQIEFVGVDGSNVERVFATYWVAQSTLFNLQNAQGAIWLRPGERLRIRSLTSPQQQTWNVNVIFGYVDA